MKRKPLLFLPSPGLAVLLSLLVAFSRAQNEETPPLQVPPRYMREFEVLLKPEARFLRVGGRFVSSAEGPVCNEIQIWFNGTLLDDRRLIGPAEVTTPLMPVDYTVIFPRFCPRRMAFAFKQDADDLLNNGPWTPFFFRERYATHHVGPFIQLDISDLPKKPVNTVRLVNGHSWATFQLSTLETAADSVEFNELLLPMPAYLILRKSPAERARYEHLLMTGEMPDVEKAELIAALGIADATTPGVPLETAIVKFRQSLETSSDFPSRSEVLYRLLAAGIATGSPPLPEAALRSALAEAPGVWGDLARALLAARDKQPPPPERPILSTPIVHQPVRADGIADEPFWPHCPSIPLRHIMGTNETVEGGIASLRAAAAPNGLALLFEGTFDPNVKFVCGLAPDSPVWDDNAIEVLIARDLQFQTYYELNVSLLGTRYDGINGWRTDHDVSWTGPWQSASRLLGETFTIEYLIPWDLFGRIASPPHGTFFIANTLRTWITLDENNKRNRRFLSPVENPIVDAHRLQNGLVFHVVSLPLQQPEH